MESGKWLENALKELCRRPESGLYLDDDVISGLVSYCEGALPEDAREYLLNIVGQERSLEVIDEYLERRSSKRNLNLDMVPKEDVQVYMKPPAEDFWSVGNRKATKVSNQRNNVAVQQEAKTSKENSEARIDAKSLVNASKKKKGSKTISIAEAAKGSIVLQQGKPCDCQARRHKLVTNCLFCGKIICEQTGEGPCTFCGALVLREGSNYAGLDEVTFPLSEAEAVAEAFKNRLVEYDRNAAERTSVIDDQSDYYELDGNKWISEEEKQLLRKRQEEIEEAEQSRRKKVVVTFDLVGRKVVLTDQEAADLETKSSILRPTFVTQNRCNRIAANPNVREQPVFIDIRESGNVSKLESNGKNKKPIRSLHNGLCFEVSGRVQHDDPFVEVLSSGGMKLTETSDNVPWQGPKVMMQSCELDSDNNECLVDA